MCDIWFKINEGEMQELYFNYRTSTSVLQLLPNWTVAVVTVMLVFDKPLHIDIKAKTTIAELKQRINNATKIPIEYQRILFKGIHLDNDRLTIADIVPDHHNLRPFGFDVVAPAPAG